MIRAGRRPFAGLPKGCSRPLACWLLPLLLATIIIDHAASQFLDGGTAFVFDEVQLRRALQNAAVNKIVIGGPISMSPELWPLEAGASMVLERPVTITNQYSSVLTYEIDQNRISRGAVRCLTSNCTLSIDGSVSTRAIAFLNQWEGPFDFANHVPGFISVANNGTLFLKNITVFTEQMYGLWDPGSLLYNTSNAWWVGNLRILCHSPYEIEVNWRNYQRDRERLLGRVPVSTGFIDSQNVVMALKPSYLKTNWTLAKCQQVLQLCNNNSRSEAPISPDWCTPEKMAVAYQYISVRVPTVDLPPAPATPGSLPGSSSGSGSNKPKLWWVGVLVGCVAAAVIAAVAALFIARQRRKRRADEESGHANKGSAAVGEVYKPGGHTSAAAHGAAGVQAYVAPADPADMTLGFTGTAASWHMLTNGAEGTATTQSATDVPSHRGTIIDLAPSMGPGGIPQLARNPLGVTLKRQLGTGAYGIVYEGMWQGQEVAVKVVRHNISDQEELQGFLQLKEAELGAGLNHPRIVRALAHAVVIPEGVVNEQGILIRSATCEAHIVSQLCDMGTLKEWLQTIHRPPMPSSNLTVMSAPDMSVQHHTTGGSSAGQVASGKIIKTHSQPEAAISKQLQKLQGSSSSKELPSQHSSGSPQPTNHSTSSPEATSSHGAVPLRGGIEAVAAAAAASRASRRSNGSSPNVTGTAPAVGAGGAVAAAQSSEAGTTGGVTGGPSSSGQGAGGTSVDSSATITHPSSSLQGQRMGSEAGSSRRPGSEPIKECAEEEGAHEAPAGAATAAQQAPQAPSSQAASKPASSPTLPCLHPPPASSSPGGGGGLNHAYAALKPLYPALVMPGVNPAAVPPGAPLPLASHADYHRHLSAVVDIMLEVVDGLEYLLEQGVVHGDLKLQNCLCASSRENMRGFSIKIGDFGISRVIHGNKTHTTVSTPPGTLAYFAPELLSTGHMSPSCDLYSFGIMMYELAACKQPFSGCTMAQVLYKKATGKIEEDLVFPQTTPDEYIILARDCWATDPADRPALPEVRARLEVVQEQLQAMSQSVSRAESRPQSLNKPSRSSHPAVE